MLSKSPRVSAPLNFTYKPIPYFPSPLSLTLDVHLPASNLSTGASSSAPALFLIHQGGFTNKSKSNLPPWLLDLAHEKGWIVVAPNYRLLVGGLTPAEEGEGGKNDKPGREGVDLGDSLDDVLDAYKWMVGGELDRVLRERKGGEELLKVDLEKLVVVGMSAGGALSLLLPTQLASLSLPQPSSVLSIYPITRPFHIYYNTPRNSPSSPYPSFNIPPSFTHIASKLSLAPVVASASDPSDRSDLWSWVVQNGWFGEMCLGKGLGEFAGRGKGDRDSTFEKTEALKARLSPLVGANAPEKGSYPRTYILHGDADVWIPFEESEWAKKRLEEAGVEVEFVRVEGEDHGFEEEMRLGVDGKYDGLWRRIGSWIEAGWR